MERTPFLRRFTDLVRYDKPYNSLPCLLMIVIGLLGAFNSFMVISTEQENLEKRLLGVKEFVTILMLFSNTVERAFQPQKSTRLVELIENEFLVNRYEFAYDEKKWKKFEVYFNQKKMEMENLSEKIYIVLVFLFIGFLNRHLFNEFLEGAIGGERILRDWPAPFVYWSPPGFNTFEFFAYLYAFQSLMVLITVVEVYCVQVSVCLAIKRLLVDFETIYTLIDDLANDYPEIDVDVSVNTGSNHRHSSENDCKIQNDNLMRDMSRIVRCYQSLNRNFKDCETNAGYVLLVISFVTIIDTCVNFYIILKNEIFRQSLTKLPWIDKPQWFKKTLHIMMIRANVDTVIKPFGIHNFDHMSFKNMIKAAFSFGNFLCTTKLKGLTE